MAHPPGTSGRVQRLTSLVAVVLIGVAIGFAFGRVFQGHAATYQLLVVGVGSGLVAAAFERRSLLLATVASVVFLVVVIGWLVFPHTTWYGLPTVETLRAIGHAAGRVGPQARYQVSPAIPTKPLLFAGITAVWAAVFSCHALAFRAGSPLLALVPPLALVVFADSVLEELTKPGYGLLFLGAGLAVVFADSLRRMQGWGPVWHPPGHRNELLPATGRAARRVGVAAVVLAALAPVVVPGFGSHAVWDVTRVGGDAEGVSISPLIGIGSQLNSTEAVPVMTVRSPVKTFWRAQSLDRYDASQGTFVQGDTSPTSITSGQVFQPPPPSNRTDPFTQTYTMANAYLTSYLPAATHPMAIDLPNDELHWDQGSDSVSSANELSAGDSYTVTSWYPQPTETELRNASLPIGALLDRNTALPPMPPEIEATARRWTENASTPYDQVVAIWRRFTAPNTEFTYRQDVNYSNSSDGIVRFLAMKQGFCQQFATTMTVMLRLLGIPARVAYGFQTGSRVQGTTDTYAVTTHDLHAWVEVYFQDYGWIPFDATPGIVNPLAQNYVPTPKPVDPGCIPTRGRPCSSTSASVSESTTTSTSSSASPPPTSSPVPPADAGRGISPIAAGVVTAILLLVLVALAIPVRSWLVRRHRLRHAAERPRELVLATYDVFIDRAARLGLGRAPGETPNEYERRIDASGRLSDGHVQRLTALAVRTAYGTAEPTSDEALDAVADADEAVKQLRDTASWRTRLLGLYRPS